MSMAKPMKVELTWILFIGLKHFELLILRLAWILGLLLSWILCLGLVDTKLRTEEARLLNFWKVSFQARVMSVWTWIEKIRPKGSNLKEIVWQLLSLHGRSSGPRGPIDLDSFSRASTYQALGAGLLNFWKISFRTRVMAVWKWIDTNGEKSPNLGTNLTVALFEQP